MPAYFSPGMHLYLERLVDWDALLTLRRGAAVEVKAEVDSYGTILETAAALAESFEGPCRENWAATAELTPDGGAQAPAHIRSAYDKLRESGFVCLSVSEEYGGYGLPALLSNFVIEMVSRADASLMTLIGLQGGVAGDIEKYGSEDVKRAYLPRFTSGELQGCMDISEPQAGSDIGGILTRSTELDDGSISVDGQKIFITNGGADVHLVLAREHDTFDASKRTTHGLSLVLVPRKNADGSPNGVRVSRLESKFGIHGSPTCEVVFEGAIGTRLGEKGKGFRAMLDLMNAARLGVAAQALGISEAAFHDALVYAHGRVQFGIPIAEQPMVKAMLAKMAVNIEGARALLYRTLALVDLNAAREAAAARGEGSAEQLAALERDTVRVRLLTPLCKYFATEICDDLTRDAIQVLGGVGYTMDTHVAKLHADSLITTIYEGTSEIQASFALREMGKGALAVVLAELREELAQLSADTELAPLAARVQDGVGLVEKTATFLFDDVSQALLCAKLMAQMVINVISGTELLRQAAADASRRDLAAAFILRRALDTEHMSRRISENTKGQLERATRIIAKSMKAEA
jgi:alkylation response protein AidB-like acyl-CoA dehydrogenase